MSYIKKSFCPRIFGSADSSYYLFCAQAFSQKYLPFCGSPNFAFICHYLKFKMVVAEKARDPVIPNHRRQIWKITCSSVFLHCVLWTLIFIVFLYVGYCGTKDPDTAVAVALLTFVITFGVFNLIIFKLTLYYDIYAKFNHPALLPQKEFKKVYFNYFDARKVGFLKFIGFK